MAPQTRLGLGGNTSSDNDYGDAAVMDAGEILSLMAKAESALADPPGGSLESSPQVTPLSSPQSSPKPAGGGLAHHPWAMTGSGSGSGLQGYSSQGSPLPSPTKRVQQRLNFTP